MGSKSVRRISMILIVILFGTLLLAGCSSEGTQPEGDTGKEIEEDGQKENGDKETKDSDEQVELDIFQFKVEIAKELKEAVETYEENNSNVKINLETVGGGDDYGAALRAKFASGWEPAIFNVGGPQDVEDWMHKLEDLSDEPWVELALPGVLDGVISDGGIYGMPYNMEGYGFIYNNRIFEAAGIDASSIQDFDSLEKAVKELDQKIKAGDLKDEFPQLEAVFELPAKEKWVTGLHTSNVFLGQEFESSIDAYNSDTVEFKYGEQFKQIIDLQANYSSSSEKKEQLTSVDYATQVDQGLAIERVAIIQQGNWIYPEVESIDPEVAENLGILPIPVKGAKEDCIPVGVPMYWAINKDQDDAVKDAAKDFINWLYTSDEGKNFVVNKFHFIPPLSGYEDVRPEDALGAAVLEYSESDKVIPWVFMGYPTGWGEDILGMNIQVYLAGGTSWDDMLKTCIEEWETARQNE